MFRAMRALMPGETYLYLGDTARLPYGTKSPATIARYALRATAELVARRVKLLVVACNTASAVALPALRAAYPQLSVEGVVEPGAEAACRVTRRDHIAVIGTESTIRGRAYEKAILRRRPQAVVVGKSCPLFVPLAEDGLVDGPLAEGIAARYLDEVFRLPRERGGGVPDCLVLACTHFPLLAAAIRRVAGPDVELVDSAATTAQAVRRSLAEQGLERTSGGGTAHFLTTDDAPRFAALGARFLGMPLGDGEVELVDL